MIGSDVAKDLAPTVRIFPKLPGLTLGVSAYGSAWSVDVTEDAGVKK
ncbi:hypothetical protein BKA19_3118 [Blastococcus saxobsidens]|uniref:Uncharacterized protein n=1 Tax=Blastococcus saxobsidens TaxID=138336 RepID=A0A4V2G2J5_9ACTN|nr:hypothetical protein BKA19_3118 [Blastococcus saxobsidens]